MTAVFAGMLVLGGAFWLSELTKLFDIPKSAWTVALGQVPSEIPTGTTVTFLSEAKDSIPATSVATGVVQKFAARAGETASATIGHIQETAGHYLADAAQISWSTGASGGTDLRTATVGSMTGIPIFNPNYLSLGVAIAAIIAGAFLVYWIVGRRLSTVDFLVAVDGEMKKVNWSTRRIIQNSTSVVIVASFLIAASLFLFDTAFSQFFQAVGVMPK